MKTILSLLLLIFVVSCSQTKPAKQAAAAQAQYPQQPESQMVVKAGPLYEEPKAATETQPAPTNATAEISTPVAPHTNAPVLAEIGAPATLPGSTNLSQRLNPARAVRGGLAGTNVAAVPSIPEPTPGPAPEQMIAAGMIDFRNAPLEAVLKLYSELVNRTLLRPAALPAPQITLTTQTQLTKSEAIQALDAVLGMNGITMINVDDKFVKAVPQPQALTEGARPDTRKAEQLPDFGAFVTHVVQLKYVKPSEIVPALQPFAKMNSILPIDSSQIIVIRDYTENVKRMLEMIDRIDISVPGEFVSEVIPIKYAKASEIADALNSLSGGGGSTSVGSRGTPTRSAVGSNSAFGNRPGGIGGYTPGTSPLGQNSAFGGAAGGTSAPGSSFSDRLQQIIRKASTSGDLQILGQTKMIADERSNSLLIFATRQDLDMIKSVVSKLDVVLAQVLIETVIMDVTLQNANSFGVSAVQTPKSFTGDLTGAGGMNASKFFDFSGGTSGNTNAVTDLLGTGLRYFGKVGQDYYVQIQAAASQGRVNVIQKPRILTSHATPGSIFVGSTVPYVTSTYYGGGYGGGPSSSYQQLQVGIGLTVTPYINPDGLVVMTIDEEISELAGSTEIQGVGAVPNTTSRKLSAEVAVRDGDSIILGGFIRNATTKNNSGVPLLKDIPLLGTLFSSRSSTKDRTELLVLMRPTVLKTPDIAALASTQEKKRLPGVSAAEAEVNEQERQEQMAEQKRQAKRDTDAAARNQNGASTNSPYLFQP